MGIETQKSVLVTGSKGFIGRRLVAKLESVGYQVIGFDLDQGDISTVDLSSCHPDHIVHLASRVYVPDSWTDTAAFYRTNMMGTINVLELCRRIKSSLTYISSYVYGTPDYLPVDENHPIHPANPYNHSKLVAEEACRYYSDTFNFPATILRPVNIYGPGQNPDFLIPKIISQVQDPNIPVIEVMDLRPKRDYLFIDDFIAAIMATFNHQGDFYNIGSGNSVSVEDIIKSVLHETGIDKPYMAKNIERRNEIWDVYMDIGKITRALGWKPVTSFRTGISQCLKATR